MGADSTAENTPNASKSFSQKWLPKPKSLRFLKTSVLSPWHGETVSTHSLVSPPDHTTLVPSFNEQFWLISSALSVFPLIYWKVFKSSVFESWFLTQKSLYGGLNFLYFSVLVKIKNPCLLSRVKFLRESTFYQNILTDYILHSSLVM